MHIILITIPVFLIIFTGWFFHRLKIVNAEWVHILNLFAYYISLPALITLSIWNIDFFDKNSLDAFLLGLGTVLAFLLFIFLILHFIKIRSSLKTAIFLVATAGNTVYMGFPIIEFALGNGALSLGALIGVIYLILPLLVSIFVIRYWHDKSHSVAEHLGEFLKNPLVISALAGFILSFLRIESALIEPIKKSLNLLGATASPVALFALGGFLYGKFLKKNLGWVFFSSILKTMVFPSVILGISLYFVEIKNLPVFAIFSAVPVAVTTFVIAEKFNIEKDLVGNAIFISTIISFFTIPTTLFFV